jgi:hypothetical protein
MTMSFLLMERSPPRMLTGGVALSRAPFVVRVERVLRERPDCAKSIPGRTANNTQRDGILSGANEANKYLINTV